jgi:hypothetical protein
MQFLRLASQPDNGVQLWEQLLPAVQPHAPHGVKRARLVEQKQCGFEMIFKKLSINYYS